MPYRFVPDLRKFNKSINAKENIPENLKNLLKYIEGTSVDLNGETEIKS